MISVRYLFGLVCVVAIGCGESDRTLGEGSLDNEATAEGDRVLQPSDKSTDPAVTLLGTAGSEAAGGAPDMNGGNIGEPDAGRVDTDEGSDEGPSTDADDADNGNNGQGGGGAEPPMTEPEAPEGDAAVDDDGSLVGTVCDLLGGLLCPVGLLCVEGSCQDPPAD